MRVSEILLVLFLWFALSSAYPKKQDDRPSIDEDNALVLLRPPRSILDPISSLGGSAMGMLNPSTDPTQTVSQLISSAVKFIVDWLIRVPLQVPMNIAVRLLNTLSSVFPTSFLPKTIDAVRDYVREGVTSLVEKAISLLWHFLSTTGLPWLYRILNQIAKLPSVPEPIQGMIKSFNTFYNLAQMLGFVSPAY